MEEDRDSLHISKERREAREMEMWVCVRPVVKREENAKHRCKAVENLKGKRRMSFEAERWFAICTDDDFFVKAGER